MRMTSSALGTALNRPVSLSSNWSIKVSMMNCEEISEQVEGGDTKEKHRTVITYVLHVHLDGRIRRSAYVLDDAHPPGFRVGKERRHLLKFRDLTAPFQKGPHDLVVYMLLANFDGIRSREMICFVIDFLTESVRYCEPAYKKK